MAIHSDLGVVSDKAEGAATRSLPKNEGRITQAWVNVSGIVFFFLPVYLWHPEGWTPRNEALMEAVVKQARTTRHRWLVACDANMDPDDFKESLWCKEKNKFNEGPVAGIPRADLQALKGELIERTYDYAIASRSLQGEIKSMEVVVRYRSRPYKAVTFLVERDKEIQKMRELTMPRAFARLLWAHARWKQV